MAEKILKAYLIFLDIKFIKTHSLVYLLDLINDKDNVTNDIYEIAESLENYAIEIRYPDNFYEPTIKEAEKTYKKTLILMDTFKKKIKV